MKKKFYTAILLIAMIMVSLVSGCSEKSKKADVIGIIGAMDVEVSTLKDATNITKTKTITGMDFC